MLGEASNDSVDPDTGDIYKGLDRFGRIKDCRWGSFTGPGFTWVDFVRLQYGYNRASSRVWRQDPIAQANSAEYDELYAYDGLQRLSDMQRGTLNMAHTALTAETFAQCWTLDATGNWQQFRQDDDAGGPGCPATGAAEPSEATESASPKQQRLHGQ